MRELSDHIDDLSSQLVASNLRNGELQARNESLTLRISENEHESTIEEMRQSVSIVSVTINMHQSESVSLYKDNY